jgi:hypothetical protein
MLRFAMPGRGVYINSKLSGEFTIMARYKGRGGRMGKVVPIVGVGLGLAVAYGAFNSNETASTTSGGETSPPATTAASTRPEVPGHQPSDGRLECLGMVATQGADGRWHIGSRSSGNAPGNTKTAYIAEYGMTGPDRIENTVALGRTAVIPAGELESVQGNLVRPDGSTIGCAVTHPTR